MTSPPFRIRYPQADIAKALGVSVSDLVTYAAAAGIALSKQDTLSEAQARTISDHIDAAMQDPHTAAQLAACHRTIHNNPPVRRRGAMNPAAARRGQ